MHKNTSKKLNKKLDQINKINPYINLRFTEHLNQYFITYNIYNNNKQLITIFVNSFNKNSIKNHNNMIKHISHIHKYAVST